MVDRIRKSLGKLTPKERKVFMALLERIVSGRLSGLDVRKLHGTDDIYRVRKGAYRVIFRKGDDGEVYLLTFERRSDTTYRS